MQTTVTGTRPAAPGAIALFIGAFLAGAGSACSSNSAVADAAAPGTGGASGGDAAADAPAGDSSMNTGAGGGGAGGAGGGACPAEIAPCAAGLQAIKTACDTSGVTCVQQGIDQTGQLNDCFANGVRIYYDPGLISVLRSDGHTCYTVDTTDNGARITNLVRDRDGNEILRATHTTHASYTSFTCNGQVADIPDDQQPCGPLDTLPPDLQCETGTCLRP